MGVETNVFVNCPFDSRYTPILRPVLLCIIDLQLEPRIALERLDSGEARVMKLIELIKESKYGIHDLSRLKADKEGEFYRLNMPFELGLDVGSRVFGGEKFQGKRCLVLEAERYRYQAAISDISNSDIAVHNNEPITALREVRNWLVAQTGLKALGPSAMWGRFNEFMAAKYDILIGRGYSPSDIDDLPIPELLQFMREWVGNTRQVAGDAVAPTDLGRAIHARFAVAGGVELELPDRGPMREPPSTT